MQTRDLAITTLTLGIIGFILSFIPVLNLFGIFFCIIGFVFGIKTKFKISKSSKALKSDSLVISGMVLCIMGAIVFIIVTTLIGIFALSL